MGESPFFETPNLSFEGRVRNVACRRGLKTTQGFQIPRQQFLFTLLHSRLSVESTLTTQHVSHYQASTRAP